MIAVYAVFFTALPVAGFLLSGPVSDQATVVRQTTSRRSSTMRAQRSTTSRSSSTTRASTCRSRARARARWRRCRTRVVEGSGEIVAVTGELLRKLIELSFYVILVIVLSIYMLIYAPRIGALVRAVMPPGDGTPEDDFPTRVQRAVFGYVRGQLLFSSIMGTSAGAALWIFGVLGIFPDGRTYAFAFGLFFGVMELVPYVGPVLGALPPIIVALVQDPLTAVWVALLFLALQQLEGHVVAPNVFGRSLRLNPLLVIFALLLGGEMYGLVGALVALPIAAVLRETVVYLKEPPRLRAVGYGPAAAHRQPVGAHRPGACAPGARPRSRSSRARNRSPSRRRNPSRSPSAPPLTQAQPCRSSTQRTGCGSGSTSGRSRFTTTGSWPERTTTHDSGSPARALISWWGT